MARITKIVVHDSGLFNLSTGYVGRWAVRVQLHYTANAIEEAPVQTRYKPANRAAPGHMKRSISGEVRRVSKRRYQTTISVNVDYATHVIRGTGGSTGVITAKNPSKPMRVPTAPGPPGAGGPVKGLPGFWMPRMTVKGQPPNNFLQAAHNKTAIRHPSLRRAALQDIGFPRTGQGGRPVVKLF